MHRLKESVFLPTMEVRQQQPDSFVVKRDSMAVDSLQADTIGGNKPAVEAPDDAHVEIEEPILPNFFHTEFNDPILPQARIADGDSWILPLLLFFFFCIALINLAFPRSLWQIATAVFRLDGIRKIQSDENAIMRKAMRLMHLVFVFLFPVFAYQMLEFGPSELDFVPSLPIYWELLLVSGGLLAGKISLITSIGYLFNCVEESTTYRHGILIMNSLLTFILIPICLAIKISPSEWTTYFKLTGAAFFGLFYLISIAIGALSGLRSKTVSKFHLILYFCALEAIPVFLILKIAKAFV